MGVKIKGTGSQNYRITDKAMEQGKGISNQQVLDSSMRAGSARNPKVEAAIDEATQDGYISNKEFFGGTFFNAARSLNFDVGDSILSKMHDDEWMQSGRVDNRDYLESQDLLRQIGRAHV